MSKEKDFKDILAAFSSRLGKENVLESSEDPKDPKTLTIKINPEKITQAAEVMTEKDFPYLSFITTVDFKQHLEMVYWFTSITSGLNIRIKCHLPPTKPEIDSLVPLFATANWNEREVYDLFGVNFRNHPEMKRILTWDEFEGHPLLKKYKVIDDPDEFPAPAPKAEAPKPEAPKAPPPKAEGH